MWPAWSKRLAGQAWQSSRGSPRRIHGFHTAAIAQFRDTLGPYADFPAELRKVMPRDALWVRDITVSNSSGATSIFPLYGPRDGVYPVSAAIGPACRWA